MAESDFLALAVDLDEAVERGDLPNPAPAGATLPFDSRNSTDSDAYIWALRDRLISLGYLGRSRRENADSTGVSPALVKAVKRFQQEVGTETLRKDGWAGPETWRIMQALVSFEGEQQASAWPIADDPIASPAVRRAAYLRLWVLGCCGDWAAHQLGFQTDVSDGNSAFADAIERFLAFADAIDLAPTQDLPRRRLSRPLLNLLFGHDRMIERIAAADAGVFEHYAEQIAALARIELWLHGYDCVPGAPSIRRRRRRWRRSRTSRVVEVPRLHQEIRRFWKDHEHQRRGAPKDAVSATLFGVLAALAQEAADPASSSDDTLEAIRLVHEKAPQAKRKGFLERLRNIAGSIWDGIGRATCSLLRKARRAVRDFGRFLKNLARVVARDARRFFHLVVRSVDAVQGGFDYLRRRVFPDQLPSSVVIARAADFDQHMLITPGASRTHPVLAAHARRARIFSAATRVLGVLLSMARDVGRAVAATFAGPLGWLRALMALGRLGSASDRLTAALATLNAARVEGTEPGAVMRYDVA